MKKFLMVLLHLLGFPALIGVIVWQTMPMITAGISYGIMVFGGVILTVAFALIYFLIVLIMAKRKKKTVYRQTFVAIITSVAFLCGLWVVVDIAAPSLLAKATSSTVWYEDVTDDFQSRADVNKALLDEFITRNYKNKTLPQTLTKAEYIEQGFANEDVQNLIKSHFQSIDKDGYQTFFPGPWVDMANDSRLTIPVLINLLLNEREEEGMPFPLYDAATGKVADGPVCWSILDILGSPMEISLEMLKGYSFIIDVNEVQAIIKEVSDDLAAALKEEEVLGSPIYLGVNGGKGVIILTPSNQERGVLDYQSMAWLDSNGLLFLVVSIMSIRKFFLIWAGIMAVSVYAIGLLRKQNGNKEVADDERFSDPRINPYANPNFALEKAELGKFNYNPDSYFVLDGMKSPNYAAMSMQLNRDRMENVYKQYNVSDFNE